MLEKSKHPRPPLALHTSTSYKNLVIFEIISFWQNLARKNLQTHFFSKNLMFFHQVAKCCTSGEYKTTLLPFVAVCMGLIFKRVGQSSFTPIGSYIIWNTVGEHSNMVSSTIPCNGIQD
jgi:hypothetical protein